MQDQSQTKPARVLQVGPDRVTITDGEVVIEARRPLPDWEVREHNIPPIFFEDKKYQLVQKTKAQPPFALRYVLQPWPEGQQANARLVLAYDAATVAERDAAHRGETASDNIRFFLMPFYPFLGMLWSGTQRKL